jgi:hypothetical protein
MTGLVLCYARLSKAAQHFSTSSRLMVRSHSSIGLSSKSLESENGAKEDKASLSVARVIFEGIDMECGEERIMD